MSGSAKDRLNTSLDEVAKIEQLLDQFEETGDRGCLVSVATMMRELHPSLRELSVWSECKTAECAPLLVTLSQRMKAAVARTRLLSKGASGAAQNQKTAEKAMNSSGVQQGTGATPAASTSNAGGIPPPKPLSGWLKKQGEKGLVKNFKERYFVQRDSHLLYFISDADVNKEPQGWIDLSRLISVHRSALPGGFDVSTNSRTFHLQVCIKNGTPDKKKKRPGSSRKLDGLGGSEVSEEAELLKYWVDGMLKWKEWQQQQIEEMNRAPASPQPQAIREVFSSEPENTLPVPTADSPRSFVNSTILSDEDTLDNTPDGRMADPLCSSFVQSPTHLPPVDSKRGTARRSLAFDHVAAVPDGEAEAGVGGAEAAAKIAELEKKLAAALKGEETALDKLKGAQMTSKQLKNELRSREEEVQTLKRDLSKREKVAEELRDQVTQMQEENRAARAQLNVLQNDVETLRKEAVSKDALLLQLGKKQRRRARQWEGPEDSEKVEAREKEEREAQGERVVWLSSELAKTEKQLKIMTDAKEKTIAALKDALDVANEKLRAVRLSKYDVQSAEKYEHELQLLKREYFGAIGVACKLSMQQSGIKVSSALDMDTLYDTVVETVDRQLWGRAISCALEGKKLPSDISGFKTQE